MDLTACNLVKTMLKLYATRQNSPCGLFFNDVLFLIKNEELHLITNEEL